MNVLDQLTIKKSPFTFVCVPETVNMSKYEISVLPALVSELVDMSIAEVKPLEKVGGVMVFEVMPHQRQDPPLIICRDADLKEYYFLWKQTVRKNNLFSGSQLLSFCDNMIKSLNISKLQTDEAAFMMIELLRFKNEYVRRV